MASHTQKLIAELGQLQASREQAVKSPRTRMAGSISGLGAGEGLLDKALTYGPKILDLGSKIADKVGGGSSGPGPAGGSPFLYAQGINDAIKRAVPAGLTSDYRPPPPPTPTPAPKGIMSFFTNSPAPVLIGGGILAFLLIKKFLL